MGPNRGQNLMAQRILNIRVRPPRVVVLIDKEADQAKFVLAVQFFSKIWGGRFGQIFAVDAKVSDALTRFRLSHTRPEFVYAIGVDDGHWKDVVRDTCQPRGYG